MRIFVRIFMGRGGSAVLKSIAVMTSGGDSPGMNAAARAVARTALYEGVRVWGINDGYHGLLEEDIRELKSMDVGDIIQRGGTFLGTARCDRWMTPEGVAECRAKGVVAHICGHHLDAEGRHVHTAICERTLCLGLERLADIPLVIGVAAGADKTTAILAALRSGYLSALATDEPTARAVLALARAR